MKIKYYFCFKEDNRSSMDMLGNFISNGQKKYKKNLIKFSAGGLRDFSRTAASNEIMWKDIFFSNKRNMINSIDSFIKNLNTFKKNINNFDEKNMKKILVNSKKVRKQIIELKQDVSKPDFGRENF